MFWSEPPADRGPQAGSALGVVDAGGPSTDGATVLMKDRLCLSTSRMCSIMLDLFLYDCKLRIDRLDSSEEMKRSRKHQALHVGVRLSALLIVVGAVAFAVNRSAGVNCFALRAHCGQGCPRSDGGDARGSIDGEFSVGF